MAVAEGASNEVQYYYLAPNVPESWTTVQRLIEHLRGQIGIAESSTVEIDSSYINSNYRINAEDNYVVMLPEATDALIRELAYAISTHTIPNQKAVPESARKTLSSLIEPLTFTNPQSDRLALKSKADSLFEVSQAINNNDESGAAAEDDDDFESPKKKKKKDESKKETSETPASTQETPPSDRPTSPDVEVINKLKAEQAAGIAPGMAADSADQSQVGRNVDTRSIRGLIEEAARKNISYATASINLRNRLLDSFLAGELADSGLGITLDQLKANNPEFYNKAGAEFSGTIESFLRNKSWGNAEYLNLLSSPEGMLQVMSDLNALRLTPNAIPTFANWKFEVRSNLTVIAAGQQTGQAQVQVSLGSDGATQPAASATTPPGPTPEQKAADTSPVLSVEDARNLSASVNRDFSKQAVSPIKALGLDPTHEEQLKQSLMVAAHFGISAEEAAGLSSEYWTVLFGTTKPKGFSDQTLSKSDIAEILKDVGWSVGRDVPQLTVQGLPISSLPLQNRLIYWMNGSTVVSDLRNSGESEDRVSAIVQAAVNPNRKDVQLNPAENVKAAQFQRAIIAVPSYAPKTTDENGKPNYAAEAEEAAYLLHLSQRQSIMRMMAQVPTNDQVIIEFEQGYVEGVDQLVDDYEYGTFELIEDDDFEFAPTPGQNRPGFIERFAGSRQKAKNNARLAGKLREKAVRAGARKATQKVKTDAGNAAATALAKIPGVGVPLAAAVKLFTDENLQKMIAAAIAGTVAAIMALISQLAGAIPVAAALGGGFLGAAAGGIIGGPIGFVIGGVVGGVGSALGANWLAGLGGGGGAETGGAAATSANAATLPTATATPTTPLATASNAVGAVIQTPAFVGIAGTFGVVTISTLMAHAAIVNSFLAEVPVLGEEYSKYVVVTKTALPDKIENNTSTPVQYKITISPRENYSIEVISATDTWKGLPSGQKLDVQPPTQDMSALGGVTINPRESKVIEYSWNVSGEDVLLVNTFDMNFVVRQDGAEISSNERIKATANVRIGNPKVGCLEFSDDVEDTGDGFVNDRKTDPWTEDEKNHILEAFTKRMATNASYLERLCPKPENVIKLYRAKPTAFFNGKGEKIPEYGGIRFEPGAQVVKIALYNINFKSITIAEYTLAHELGHVIDDWNAGLRANFNKTKKGGCYTYPLVTRLSDGRVTCPDTEAFAEAIADYIVYTTNYFPMLKGTYDFKTRWPDDFNWIKQNIFGGKECSPNSCNE